RHLQLMSSPQILEVLLTGGHEQIPLRPITGWIPHHVLEISKELDGVHGEADVELAGKLGPHPAHTLSGRALPQIRLALQNEHVGAAGLDEMVSNTGTDDARADDHNIRSLHWRDFHIL